MNEYGEVLHYIFGSSSLSGSDGGVSDFNENFREDQFMNENVPDEDADYELVDEDELFSGENDDEGPLPNMLLLE
ncbi:hypothetical protein CASFOL_038449 [Castilleja foliolosa]|uniref:Uncharacterized protein n=1 Tax=Castilleja foliolosa TaxID=1961234 RepID=A0ABD3BL03_9LAMI